MSSPGTNPLETYETAGQLNHSYNNAPRTSVMLEVVMISTFGISRSCPRINKSNLGQIT